MREVSTPEVLKSRIKNMVLATVIHLIFLFWQNDFSWINMKILRQKS